MKRHETQQEEKQKFYNMRFNNTVLNLSLLKICNTFLTLFPHWGLSFHRISSFVISMILLIGNSCLFFFWLAWLEVYRFCWCSQRSCFGFVEYFSMTLCFLSHCFFLEMYYYLFYVYLGFSFYFSGFSMLKLRLWIGDLSSQYDFGVCLS